MKKIALFVCVAVSVCCLFGAVKISGVSPVYYGETVRSIPVYSVDRDDMKISISFDCAWGTEKTDEILACLDEYNVKCTFFAVEFWVKKYPEYAKKIVEKGHELGTHSATHSHMSRMNEADIKKELESSSKAIEDATGQKPTLFRPPFGEYNDLLVDTARKLNLEVIQWNVDSLDWKNISSEQIAKRVVGKVESGSIILCHNNGLHTAEALPAIFTALQRKGFCLVPIGDLIYRENFVIDGTGKQIKND